MKRSLLILGLILCSLAALAQTPKDVKYVFTEASDLNLIGKIHKETPNPYHRVDTVKYKGFTTGENRQVRCPAGLAVLFKTNSSVITVQTDWGWEYSSVATMPIAYRGYDLYIKKDGKWLWAAAYAPKHGAESEKNMVLIKDMDNSEKECLLYLPMYSEIYSCKIGTQEGSFIESIESPFRYRVGTVSYTHRTLTTTSTAPPSPSSSPQLCPPTWFPSRPIKWSSTILCLLAWNWMQLPLRSICSTTSSLQMKILIWRI